MRSKNFLFYLTIGLLLLCGCTRQDSAMQTALDLRGALLSAGGCAFSAEITADYGQQTADFALDCRYSTAKGARMTLTQPQTLEGLSAHIDADGGRLEYDGAIFALGPLAEGRLAPMELPLLLGKSWGQAYIYAAGREDGCIRLTYKLGYEEDELTVDTWLDQAELPCRCELSYAGTRLLIAELRNFQWTRGQE